MTPTIKTAYMDRLFAILKNSRQPIIPGMPRTFRNGPRSKETTVIHRRNYYVWRTHAGSLYQHNKLMEKMASTIRIAEMRFKGA